MAYHPMLNPTSDAAKRIQAALAAWYVSKADQAAQAQKWPADMAKGVRSDIYRMRPVSMTQEAYSRASRARTSRAHTIYIDATGAPATEPDAAYRVRTAQGACRNRYHRCPHVVILTDVPQKPLA